MVTAEFVVTLDRIDGYRVVTDLGRLTGAAVRPRSMLRDTFRSIGLFIGLAPTEYLTDAEHARADCLEDLRKNADALGANGIINLQFVVSESAEGSTRVLASGQAVVLEPSS